MSTIRSVPSDDNGLVLYFIEFQNTVRGRDREGRAPFHFFMLWKQSAAVSRQAVTRFAATAVALRPGVCFPKSQLLSPGFGGTRRRCRGFPGDYSNYSLLSSIIIYEKTYRFILLFVSYYIGSGTERQQ